MACPGAFTPPPAGSVPGITVTPAIKRFADQTLASHLASNDPPLFGYKLATIAGQNYIAFCTKHTTCNGVPGMCCDAISVYGWSGPMEPSNTVSVGVNWPAVVGTAVAGAAVVGLFLLAIKHAGRARRRPSRR